MLTILSSEQTVFLSQANSLSDSSNSELAEPRRLLELFARVFRGLRRQGDHQRYLRGVTLQRRHALVLAALVALQGEPRSVGDLAEHLGLNLTTVSGVVAELERAGLVRRDQDPADRRRTIVRVLERRREAIDAWLDGAAAPILATLERLTPGERIAWVKAMELLERELAGEQDEDEDCP